jgi:CRISPR system Cascade subunit CasE
MARDRSNGGKFSRHHEGPDATMSGTLRIDDPSAFASALSHGIGRHRTFGFGMLLLAPPR